jgi:NAD(P)H-hydrate repair Nnr-like enzyme with NAD(P)H-hydrate dehydratase domain
VAEGPFPLNAEWLRAHPLPAPSAETDKNKRGHVVVVGGSRQVPGGLLLTAEAALRAGAGKV